jgi:hypothetical protein
VWDLGEIWSRGLPKPLDSLVVAAAEDDVMRKPRLRGMRNCFTITDNAFLTLKQLYALQVQCSMSKQVLCDNYYSDFVPMIHTFIIVVSSLGSSSDGSTN